MKITILMLDRFFGQALYPWQSLNLTRVQNSLERFGFEVEIVDMLDVVNNNIYLKNEMIFFTSSQIPEAKAYIDDVVTFLKLDNTLIPNYELFRCHDNKGFQELLKARWGINGITAEYYPSINKLTSKKIEFPKIIKKTSGASSMGVWLAKNNNQFNKILTYFKIPYRNSEELKIRLKGYINSRIRNLNDWEITKAWFKYLKTQKGERIIIQEFIEGLDYDYKILVFYDQFYVLKRFMKKSDFKASGSGRFEWVEKPDDRLLNYAQKIFEKLRSPFASLDICSKDDSFYLIEFQVPHMGPLTLLESNGYFKIVEGEWKFIRGESHLEETYGYSIYKFIEETYA